MNNFTHWSSHRQFLGKRGKDAIQVLKDIIGVYSWHPSAPLSIWSRLSSFTKNEFNELDQNKQAIRIPPMRLSNYMLEQEMAPVIFAATIPSSSDPYWEKRYGKFIPIDKYSEWKELILHHTNHPMSLAELKEEAKDVPADLLKFMLNRMAFEGIIQRIGSSSLRSNIIQYVATESWIGHPFTNIDPQEALVILGKLYLKAFGPARISDFKWWSGVTSANAKKAISLSDTVNIGDGYLLLSEDAEAFESFQPSGKDSIDILPQWDSYIMGYAPDGRERFVSPDVQEQIYGKIGATGGNGLGTVLVNGMAQGSWSSKFKGNQITINLNMFEKPSSKLKEIIRKNFHEMASFLEIKKVVFP